MRVSKVFIPILILMMLSLLCISCDSGIPEASDTYTETPSEAVTTEEITVPDEITEIEETKAVTTEETTTPVKTEEVTTVEITTEEVTTAEVTTAEVTTAEVTTAEVTTEVITTAEETTAPPEPHEHVWGAWTLVRSARCVDNGEEKRVCVCGASETRYTPALGHIEGRFITVEKATCISAGYGHRICGRCTIILSTEHLLALGHSFSETVKKATCTEDGFEKISCKTCGAETGFKILKASGHTEGRTITVEKATCTENGLQHIICSVCTLILREETVSATGHTVGPFITSEELSTDEISVRQKHCVSCGLLMHEERVKSLTLIEAERVAALINSVSGNNSFTFAALSDMHVDNVGTGYNQIPTKKSCEFAAKTISILERKLDIDAAVLLGDYTASSRDYTADHVIKDFEYVRECFSGLGDYPVAWIRGNHEINYYKESDRPMTNEEIYENIESNSRGMIVDPLNPTGGYGYIDFPANKIRMIFLNTSDVYSEYTFSEGEDAPSVGISSAQLLWFAHTALDFSDKSDPSEWGIILNSHIPLNYTDDTARVLLLLEAYRCRRYGSISYEISGRSYSIEYDYFGIECAEIICSIHGHSHNFRSEMISSSNKIEPWLWRICIPNVLAGRENECAAAGDKFALRWGDFDENGEPLYYTKCHWDDELGIFIYDEENGTSFCMITVDRDARKIYAHYVGTGRDRTFGY